MSGTHEALKPEGEARALGSSLLPWQAILVAVGTLAAAGTGGGVYVSHGSVTKTAAEISAKMDQVLDGQKAAEIKFSRLEEGQRALDLKFARLEGEGNAEKFRELDTRLRSIEGLTAELRGARGGERR